MYYYSCSTIIVLTIIIVGSSFFLKGFLHQIRGYELRSGGMRSLHEMWVGKCHLHEIRGYFQSYVILHSATT